MLVVIVIGVLLVVGALRKPRTAGYWMWGAAALVWTAYVGTALLGASGTLQHPELDGLITRGVRAAVNDGPWMGLYVIVAMVGFYGVLVWMLQRALKHTATPPSSSSTLSTNRESPHG